MVGRDMHIALILGVRLPPSTVKGPIAAAAIAAIREIQKRPLLGKSHAEQLGTSQAE
jgi:hypothetical protein